MNTEKKFIQELVQLYLKLEPKAFLEAFGQQYSQLSKEARETLLLKIMAEVDLFLAENKAVSIAA